MFVIVGIAVLVAALLVAYHTPLRLPARRQQTRLPLDQTPDTPAAFGLGTSWLAIRTRDTERVAEALSLTEVQSANWRSGVAGIYDERFSESYVFVTPPVGGWTFVAGLALPHPVGGRFIDKCLPLVEDLGRRFIEVQYFFTYPVLGLFGWARALDGRLVRAYAWGDDGAVWNRGKVTREEKTLGLRIVDPPGEKSASSGSGSGTTSYPSENHVIQLAGKWGLDPTKLDQKEGAESLGLFGKVPASWRLQRREIAVAPPPVPRRVGKPDLRPVT